MTAAPTEVDGSRRRRRRRGRRRRMLYDFFMYGICCPRICIQHVSNLFVRLLFQKHKHKKAKQNKNENKDNDDNKKPRKNQRPRRNKEREEGGEERQCTYMKHLSSSLKIGIYEYSSSL